MKIALCSSAAHLTPPVAYGSEVTAWYLAEDLALLGHEVTLIAAEGSRVPPGGRLIPLPLDLMRAPEVERQAVLGLVEELRACDLVHDMSSSHCFADVKHETGSCHHLVTINGISWITPHYKHNVVVLSEAARQAALTGEPAWPPEYPQWRVSTGTLPGCEVAHYGTDTEFYRPLQYPESNRRYILYVGRPHPSKGVHVILDIAERMPEQLFVSGVAGRVPGPHGVRRRVRGPSGASLET